MSPTLVSIFVYLYGLVGSLYAAICLLRVLLQLSRANYYNPISQFIVKATQPVTKVLRSFIPTWKRLDLAGVAWCLLFQLIAIELAALILLQTFINPVLALSWGAIGLLSLLISIFYFGMIVLIIASVATLLGGAPIRHPALDLLTQIMAPVLQPLQRLIPPIGGLDLSPILLFVFLNVCRIILMNLENAAGLLGGSRVLVPGLF